MDRKERAFCTQYKSIFIPFTIRWIANGQEARVWQQSGYSLTHLSWKRKQKLEKLRWIQLFLCWYAIVATNDTHVTQSMTKSNWAGIFTANPLLYWFVMLNGYHVKVDASGKPIAVIARDFICLGFSFSRDRVNQLDARLLNHNLMGRLISSDNRVTITILSFETEPPFKEQNGKCICNHVIAYLIFNWNIRGKNEWHLFVAWLKQLNVAYCCQRR